MVELLVGVTVALCLAIAIGPVWLSLQRTGEGESDRGIWLLQARVAIARFEADLRLSGAGGCLFPAIGAILEATPTQIVFLERAGELSPPVLVEWEIVKGALMRRTGACPPTRPAAFSHSLYSDNKTMLASVTNGSFSYVVRHGEVAASLSLSDLAGVTAVVLQLAGGSAGLPGESVAMTTARVSR